MARRPYASKRYYSLWAGEITGPGPRRGTFEYGEKKRLGYLVSIPTSGLYRLDGPEQDFEWRGSYLSTNKVLTHATDRKLRKLFPEAKANHQLMLTRLSAGDVRGLRDRFKDRFKSIGI